jgi:hypothetical protein
MVTREFEWSLMDRSELSGRLPLRRWDDYSMGVFPKFKKVPSLCDLHRREVTCVRDSDVAR